MMNSEEYIKIIKDILNRNDIDACYLFGSFLTNSFSDESDIDIAIIGDIELEERLYLEGLLEHKLNRSIDLVRLIDLPYYIQLQVVSRNRRLIFKDNENTYNYLEELDKWYKEEYPFWMKMQREIGYEI